MNMSQVSRCQRRQSLSPAAVVHQPASKGRRVRAAGRSTISLVALLVIHLLQNVARASGGDGGSGQGRETGLVQNAGQFASGLPSVLPLTRQPLHWESTAPRTQLQQGWAGRQLRGLYGGGRVWQKHATPVPRHGTPHTSHASFKPPHADSRERRLGQGILISDSLYWWNETRYTYLEAGDMCSEYGGSLAVLASATGVHAALPADLDNKVKYWIGLFQVPGSTWTWIDQTPYSNEAAAWAAGQPADGVFCTYIQWSAADQEWQWVANDCNTPAAVLCELPQNGLVTVPLPFSCMQQSTLSLGPVYQNASLGGSDSSQYPHLCSAMCRADTQCAAFTVAGGICQLQKRLAGTVVQPYRNTSLTVSCLRYGLDFVSMGRRVAQTRLQNSTDKNTMWKCMPDYLVNMEIGSTLAGICDPAACADACNAAGSSCCGGSCTAFVHSRAHCICQLGSNPLLGTDLHLGPDTGSLSEGYTTCLREDADWLRMGSVGDPSEVSFVLSDRAYTLHPEPLGYEAAMAACKAENPASMLASITSLNIAISLAQRLLLAQPPRMLSPAQSVPNSMYGMWVGLQGVDGSALAAALASDPSQPQDPTLTWADGTPVDSLLVQNLWAVSPDGVPQRVPSASSSQRMCVFFSNETGMMRPGLAAADACSWELPFVCESPFVTSGAVYPTLSSPDSPAPGTQAVPLQLAQTSMAGITTLSVATPIVSTAAATSDSGASLTNTSVSETAAANSPPVAGMPNIVTIPDTGVMMWIQPNTEPQIDHDLANEWCGLWNGSLATLYNATAQAALTGEQADVSLAYWINLAVNSTTQQWAWGQPNNPNTSAGYLDKFADWCQGSPPNISDGKKCAQLQFAPDCQTTDGWGWVASDCSDAASYMCTAAPKGTPGRYFCAENYALDGKAMAAFNYPDSTPVEAASYCAVECTKRAGCHAFTVTDTKCSLKSRNTTSFSFDAVRDNIAVGCFKYSILWDTLGGLTAVHYGVGSDLTTRYRCIERQNIARTDLSVVRIKSCSLSDCTAQCFSMRLCKMVVFDHSTCRCTLAHNPLAGYDGDNSIQDNITTCLYDDDASFLGIGLVRSAQYITPPVDAPSGSGQSGWWDIPPGGISTNSGNLSDINFDNSNPNLPSTNPSDPTKKPPSPSPSFPPPPTPTPPGTPNSPPSPASPVFSPPPPPSRSPPGPIVSNPDSIPSTSPLTTDGGNQLGASTSSGSKSSFGVPQMVGITAGFCGGVLLLLASLIMFVIRRRRRRAARLGSGGLDPKDREATLASIRGAGLSPDLERLVVEWVEGRYTSDSGNSDGGAMLSAMPALTPTLTKEIETVIKQEQEGQVQLSSGAVSVLSQLLINIQASPKSSSTLQSGSTTAGGDPGMVQPRETLFTSSAGVSDAYTASTTENSTAEALDVVVGAPGSREQLQTVADAAVVPQTGSPATQTQPRLQSVDVSALVPVGFEASSAMTSKSGICSTYITLSRLLGAGSFGTVYEGLWRKQPVAVKIIPHSPSAAPRVKNEVELAMQFDHPNVVRSYFYETFDTRAGVGTLEAHTAQRDTQETWIVLEYCSEGSLASRLYAQHNHQAAGPGAQAEDSGGNVDDVVVPRPMHERDPCISSLAGVLQMAQGVAQGMAYMHSLAICHGDLKCENVLLGGPGSRGSTDDCVVPKVGDFGLSRAIGDISSHLSTATVGTVTHMPPELLLSGQLRPSCDVYSFGIMLWQLYTGAVPYAGMRYAEIVYKVAVCAMRPAFPTDTPRAYKQLAEDCWQSEATARPSFEQVVNRLADLLQQVDQLEAERQLALQPCTPARCTMYDAHSSSECSNDITLQSPWIAACPHPSNCGLPDIQPNTMFTANPVFVRPGWTADLDSGSLGANSQGQLALHGGVTDASMSASSSPMHALPSFAPQVNGMGVVPPTMQHHLMGNPGRGVSLASPTTTLIPALVPMDAGSSGSHSRGMPAVMYMPVAASPNGVVAGSPSMPAATSLGSARPSPYTSPRDPALLDDSGSPKNMQGGPSTTAMRMLYPPGTPTVSMPADQHQSLLATSDSVGACSIASSTAVQPPDHGLLERHTSLQPQQAGLLPRRASLSPSGSLQPQVLQHMHLQLPPQGPLLGHEPVSGRTPHRSASRLSTSASAAGVQSPPGSARSSAQQPLPPLSPGMHEAPITASRRMARSVTNGAGRHLPGIEAHLKLRATSASQAKLGMHGLSLLDSFGQAVSPPQEEPGPGMGQDAA